MAIDIFNCCLARLIHLVADVHEEGPLFLNIKLAGVRGEGGGHSQDA